MDDTTITINDIDDLTDFLNSLDDNTLYTIYFDVDLEVEDDG